MRAKTTPWKTNEPHSSAGKMEGFRLKLTRTKKIAAAVAAVAVIGGMAVGSTLAYLTDQKEATNTITVGDVKIELHEPGFPESSAPSMEPGMKQAKDPYLENTGSNPAYVRLRVDIPTATIGGQENTPLFELGYLDGDEFKTDIFVLQNGVQNENGETSLMLDGDPGKWHGPANGQTEGYLYYVEPLHSQPPASVFKNVRIPSSWDNEKLEGKTLKIDVTAEALQVSGQNRDPSQVQWPETVKPASQS